MCNLLPRIMIFLLISISLTGFGQQKDCYTINGPAKTCDLKIVRERNDTIVCFVKDDNCSIKYDVSKNKTWIIYWQDTTKMREIISFSNGKQTNNHSIFYTNGELACQSSYKNGTLTGGYLQWYENGKIERSGMYVKGRFIGTRFKYWDNGKVAEVETVTETSYLREYVIYYDQFGKVISKKEFDEMWFCN